MSDRVRRQKIALVGWFVLAGVGAMTGIAFAFLVMLLYFGGVDLVVHAWHDELKGYYWQGIVATIAGIVLGFNAGGALWVFILRRTEFLSSSEIDEMWKSLHQK